MCGAGVAHPELCADNIDQDCNGTVDDVPDVDGDGFTACTGDCCETTSQCANPALVNPGAFDVPGNLVDDDCNGQVDDHAICDRGLVDTNPSDAARGLGLCTFTTQLAKTAGVIAASYSLADGTGMPDPRSHALLPSFGTNNVALEGTSLLVLSTGLAKVNTDPMTLSSFDFALSSGLPFQYGGTLTSPVCTNQFLSTPHDPVMLTLTLRVPTNAHGFSFKANYLTGDYVDSVCSNYADQFVALVQPTGLVNPLGGNVAVVQAGRNLQNISVDLAAGNTGFLTQCVAPLSGCATSYVGCTGTSGLVGTGFDLPGTGSCNVLRGAGTGWLTVSAAATPGSQLTLRLAIWDSGDGIIDSTVLLDAFQWLATTPTPGAAF